MGPWAPGSPWYTEPAADLLDGLYDPDRAQELVARVRGQARRADQVHPGRARRRSKRLSPPSSSSEQYLEQVGIEVDLENPRVRAPTSSTRSRASSRRTSGDSSELRIPTASTSGGTPTTSSHPGSCRSTSPDSRTRSSAPPSIWAASPPTPRSARRRTARCSASSARSSTSAGRSTPSGRSPANPEVQDLVNWTTPDGVPGPPADRWDPPLRPDVAQDRADPDRSGPDHDEPPPRTPRVRYVRRKLVQLFLILLAVTFLSFMMLNLLPGDPPPPSAGSAATEEGIDEVRKELGLDDPIPSATSKWLADALTGDLGESAITGQPVWEALAATHARRPWSCSSTPRSSPWASPYPAASWPPQRPDGPFDKISSGVAFLFFAIPNFVLALWLIYPLRRDARTCSRPPGTPSSPSDLPGSIYNEPQGPLPAGASPWRRPRRPCTSASCAPT